MPSPSDETRRAFCAQLQRARERAGLSQRQLGMLAGMDEFVAGTRINRYERGVHEPDFATAKRLADALQVPLSYLFAANDREGEWIRAYQRLPRSRVRSIIDSAD